MCALVGMVLASACAGPVVVRLDPDDVALDRVWAALARGDVDRAAAAAQDVTEPRLRARARADVRVAVEGRAVVLTELAAGDASLAARYLASGRRARAHLRECRSREGDHTALALEDARRSASRGRREAQARGLLDEVPGGAEALALLTESLVARGRYDRAADLLETAPDTRRLRLVRRQVDAFTGALRRAATGLADDLERDEAVPSSVDLLGRILEVFPLPEVEARVLAYLDAGGGAAPAAVLQDLAERRLHATLLVRSGRLAEAVRVGEALLAEASGGRPRRADRRRLDRWRARALLAAGRAPDTTAAAADPLLDDPPPAPEARVDADPSRTRSEALDTLRLAHEWDVAARAAYDEYAASGDTLALGAFLARLDEAAAPLGVAAPALADAPRIDYGLFGEMLDTRALAAELPGAFIAGGKALGMTPELTWYDRVTSRTVTLPDPPGGSYEEAHVVNLRVPGFAASRGARYAGAGLDRFVFLDLDQVGVPDVGRVAPAAPRPWPASGHLQRRDLSEPLDTARVITAAVLADVGDRYAELELEALSLHEGRHIVDVREFLAGGLFDRLGTVLAAGLLPGAVRAEVERRAQLEALREATDPRIPLAHALAYLPAEGAVGEHALGYAALLRDFVEVLDEGTWAEDASLEALGLERNRVLVQQLHLLPPEVVRAVAWAVEM